MFYLFKQLYSQLDERTIGMMSCNPYPLEENETIIQSEVFSTRINESASTKLLNFIRKPETTTSPTSINPTLMKNTEFLTDKEISSKKVLKTVSNASTSESFSPSNLLKQSLGISNLNSMKMSNFSEDLSKGSAKPSEFSNEKSDFVSNESNSNVSTKYSLSNHSTNQTNDSTTIDIEPLNMYSHLRQMCNPPNSTSTKNSSAANYLLQKISSPTSGNLNR